MTLDKLKGFLLGGVDAINILFCPFEKFTRAAEPIEFITLEERANFYWYDIQQNWLHGLDNEFYWSMRPNDLGDMAIWQGLYTFTCALKNDPEALRKAFKGQALLQTLSGNNRLARGADATNGSFNVDPSRTYYKNGSYTFLQEVSESTLIGHLLGLWSVYHLGNDASLKEQAAALVEALASRVIEDGYQLKNQAGVTAKFGDLRPTLLAAPIRIASLACLLLLSYKMSGNTSHKELYEKIVSKYADALTRLETHVLWIHPQYQDMLVYFVLAMFCSMEYDVSRKLSYVATMNKQWVKNKEEGNSFYTYMAIFVGINVDDRYRENAKKILSEFNTNPSLGPTKTTMGKTPDNSRCKSFVWGWSSVKGGHRYSYQPMPVWRRPAADIVWQRSPYDVEGESDHAYNGLDYLAAYYLGRNVRAL